MKGPFLSSAEENAPPPPSSFHSSPYERSLKGLHLPHPPSSSSPLPDMLRSSQASSGQPSILYLDAGLSVTSVKPPMALTGEERKQIGGRTRRKKTNKWRIVSVWLTAPGDASQTPKRIL
ncbi:hypothetical protein F7725_022283 [Dissostichus mawsoni]|uniref:Uncharacterized protein n=1 Tax=Dissostichus mawsoni TaxID=36200 RepID=A0A7J5Z1P1_DISMA|nr:hypothetical protein F7725_022283 [Dissostichus mawsoni]